MIHVVCLWEGKGCRLNMITAANCSQYWHIGLLTHAWTHALSSYAHPWTWQITPHQPLTIKNISARCIDPGRRRRARRRAFNRDAHGACCLGVINFCLVCDPCRGRSATLKRGKGRGGAALWAEIIVIFCHHESRQKDLFPVTTPAAARLRAAGFYV